MLAVAQLDVARARHRRAWIDQVRGIEHPRAILALIAARTIVAAMRTRAFDVAVRQEPPISARINLPRRANIEKPLLPKHFGEVLRQLAVLLARRAPPIFPRQTEPLAELLLNGPPLGA